MLLGIDGIMIRVDNFIYIYNFLSTKNGFAVLLLIIHNLFKLLVIII